MATSRDRNGRMRWLMANKMQLNNLTHAHLFASMLSASHRQ